MRLLVAARPDDYIDWTQQLEDLASVSVEVVENGTDALARFEETPPDVLLAGPGLADMAPIDLLLGAREVAPRLATILILPPEEKDLAMSAYFHGIDLQLTEPVETMEIVAAVSVLHRLSVERESAAQATQALTEIATRFARAAEYYDAGSWSHLERVGAYASAIARGLDLPEQTCALLATATLLHDVGKVGVPDSLLMRPGSLSKREFKLVKEHARLGHDLLTGGGTPLTELAAEIAHAHHERFDGTGYPEKLAGEHIPISARITGLADVFDILTSERPYKPAWPLEAARAYIEENAGTQFCPRCVAAFLRVWPEMVEIYERFPCVPPGWGYKEGLD